VKKGYAEQRRYVVVHDYCPALVLVVDCRVDRGYRKAVLGGGSESPRTLELGYSVDGTPCRQELKTRSKPSRPSTVTAKERWGRAPQGDGGTVLLETTSGRKTREEARRQELGGRRRLWVR
jgi:ribosomal protein S8